MWNAHDKQRVESCHAYNRVSGWCRALVIMMLNPAQLRARVSTRKEVTRRLMLTQRMIYLIRCPYKTNVAIPYPVYVLTQWNALRETHQRSLLTSDLQCLKAD